MARPHFASDNQSPKKCALFYVFTHKGANSGAWEYKDGCMEEKREVFGEKKMGAYLSCLGI